MTTGELSRRTGVPIRRLIDWAERGVLEARATGSGRWRDFSDTAERECRILRDLKRLGIPFRHCRDLVRQWRAAEGIGLLVSLDEVTLLIRRVSGRDEEG